MRLPSYLLTVLPLLAACTQVPRAVPALSTPPSPAVQAQGDGPVREEDEYTRYELLDPASARFHILFEVTAVEPGATFYFNPIRKGSAASEESVRDLATGQPLRFDVVGGEEARSSGLPEADPATSYIRVHLPRPVPQDGGVRLLIEKTYADPQSYQRKGTDRIVFSRTLKEVGPNAKLADQPPEIVARLLKTEVEGEIAVSGADLAGQLARAGLIDEYQLYMQPVVLGGGTPYFAHGLTLELDLLGTESLPQGVTLLRYRPTG